jgi:hypothetical protein
LGTAEPLSPFGTSGSSFIIIRRLLLKSPKPLKALTHNPMFFNNIREIKQGIFPFFPNNPPKDWRGADIFPSSADKVST